MMKPESKESFEIRKQMNNDEIEKMANRFYEEHIAPMFPPDVICLVCGAENCPCNETCIKCNCQL